MKKVRIMLSAIAVFAVLGGAFAFKAKPVSHQTLFTTTSATGACINETTIYNITSSVTPTRVYVTTEENGSCSLQYLTTAEN